MLLAGLRVVSVSTVSLVSVGALIGVSNLGSLFTDGFQRDYDSEIFTGVLGHRPDRCWSSTGCSSWSGALLLPWTARRPGAERRA